MAAQPAALLAGAHSSSFSVLFCSASAGLPKSMRHSELATSWQQRGREPQADRARLLLHTRTHLQHRDQADLALRPALPERQQLDRACAHLRAQCIESVEPRRRRRRRSGGMVSGPAPACGRWAGARRGLPAHLSSKSEMRCTRSCEYCTISEKRNAKALTATWHRASTAAKVTTSPPLSPHRYGGSDAPLPSLAGAASPPASGSAPWGARVAAGGVGVRRRHRLRASNVDVVVSVLRRVFSPRRAEKHTVQRAPIAQRSSRSLPLPRGAGTRPRGALVPA